MDVEHESNGRATIREVHSLLTETRTETNGLLKNMEERITHSVNASETRILAALGDLGARVTALEMWRVEQEQDRAVRVASKDARGFYFVQTMRWMEDHWKILSLIGLIALSIFSLVLNIDIHTK